VLVYGTIDWVELGRIHWRVKEVSPAWEWFCLLELTRRGTVLARAIEGQAQR
jgi:hypothetical protein